MKLLQQTIEREVSCTGIGLHTGTESTVTFKPGAPNSGIRFVRTDLSGCPEIEADIDHVANISRGTSLEVNGIRIHTVEHVLAAASGLQIDNLLIELAGKEPPAMDGSCHDFVTVLKRAGIVTQDYPRQYLQIDRAITFADETDGADITVFPSEEFRVTCIVDYPFSPVGTQHFTIHSLEDFAEKIAPARTFCLLSEVEELRNQGLARGGSLENTIVVIDREMGTDEIRRLQTLFGIEENLVPGSNGILQGVALRFDTEPVRHKILDLIGDLALLGMPLKAHVIAARSGHASHVELARRIRKECKKNPLPTWSESGATSEYQMDVSAIEKIMPHRYPFLLVDRIVDLKPGKSLVAIKNCTVNEPFFQGHFPDQPVMPGVLILEGMAQAGGFLVLHTTENPETKMMYFATIDNARFRHPVIPGDQIRFELKLLKFRMGSMKIEGKAYVEDRLVAEAIFIATIVDRKRV